MGELKNTINLLSAVVSTMDTISVTGIDNQDKFVGCANAVQTVIKQLREQIAAPVEKQQEVTDG